MALKKSGVGGKVLIGSSPFLGVTGWNMTLTSNNPKFVTSDDAGHQNSVRASKSASGTVNCILDADLAQYTKVQPGDAVTLLLHEDANRKWTMPARIETIGETVELENNEITVPITWSNRGAWTDPEGNVSSTPQ